MKILIVLFGTFSSSFIFKNPNESERCGCGESFKV